MARVTIDTDISPPAFQPANTALRFEEHVSPATNTTTIVDGNNG